MMLITPIFDQMVRFVRILAVSHNTNPYAAIVNVPSFEKPSMMRIAPGTPNLSWLFHKIAGTQGTVPGPFVSPGPGGRMPQGCSGSGCVSASDLTIVQNWITGGANP